MRKIFNFTVKKEMALMLPIPLVCKKNGYTQKYMGPTTGWVDAVRFCDIGETYDLVSAETVAGETEFIMKTDTVLDDDTVIQTTHKMDYEFMAEYFHVSF